MSNYQSEYYQANKEKLKRRALERYYANRELRLQQVSEYQRNNPEVRKRASAKYRKANPDKIAEWIHRRRAKIAGARVGQALTLQQLCDFYGAWCMVFGCTNTNLTVDHVVPLTRGGEHTASNQQILCGSHNSSKGNRSSADYRPFTVVSLS